MLTEDQIEVMARANWPGIEWDDESLAESAHLREAFRAGVRAVISTPAAPSRADQLVRKYIECLVTNDPDGASDATKSMVDYVFNCPPATAHEAKAAPAVPQSKRYTVEPHGSGFAVYDGRDMFHHGMNLAHITETTPEVAKLIERGLNALAAPAVPQGWHISERKIDGQDAVIINGPMGGCVAYKDSDIPRVLPESILYELATAMLAATPAAPSQPVTLTDEEICECFGIDGADDWVFKGAHAIIAALREKEQYPVMDDVAENAARYVWLRDVHIGDNPEFINLEPHIGGLDGAIDALREKGGA